MLLALDIGNTNVTIGVFQGAQLRATWRVASDSERMSDEYAAMILSLIQMEGLGRADITAAVIASGVPPLTRVFEGICQRQFDVTALRVGAGVKTGIRVLYEDPREVGPDR